MNRTHAQTAAERAVLSQARRLLTATMAGEGHTPASVIRAGIPEETLRRCRAGKNVSLATYARVLAAIGCRLELRAVSEVQP